MKNTPKKYTPKKPALLVRFSSGAEYERLKKAAAKEQAPIKKVLSEYRPSVSRFMRRASNEKADVVLGKSSK